MDKAKKPQRWWLPGPPPPRRFISLEAVEESYRRDDMPELCVPVRHITVALPDRGGSAAGVPYTDCLDQPPSSVGAGCNAPSMYLFHGCGNAITSDVVRSFARRGPSIRFARRRGYFSTNQAVNWSNSIDFAIAWSFFAETGDWNLDQFDGNRPFRCLIFVSKLDFSRADIRSEMYLIDTPRTPIEEEELGNWCEANMNSTSQTGRIPPPKTTRADWGLIGSRVPRHTMQSLKAVHDKPDRIWLFAACDEAFCRILAGAAVEILHITYTVRGRPGSRL